MNKKRILTIVLLFFSGLLLAGSGLFVYAWYTYTYRYLPSEGAITHKANHIAPEDAVAHANFKVCKEHFILEYYYLGKFPYKTNKNGFRNTILSQYPKNKFSSNGYVFIRFLVNCQGAAGRYVVETFDLDLQSKSLDTAMVNTLLTLTQQMQDWEIGINQFNKPYDYSMYIAYRIEDGKITAILP